MLNLNNISYRIDGRPLFDQASARIPTGKRVALFGRNGTGKTTLLRLIQGEIALDDGDIQLNKGASLGAIAQEAPDGPQSLLDTVINSDKELRRLKERAETATDAHEVADIHERLALMDAYTAEARAAAILAGLGFDSDAQARPCSSFSGGWRMRVALASALFNQPDLLLLDEPTNYLDLEGVIWLESFIKTYPGTLIIVSHDRDLLNKAVDGILHLKDQKLKYYTGNYDQFEATRLEQQAQNEALRAKQDADRKHLQAYVDRFRYKASKAKQAQSRIKMLARLKPIASATDDHTVPFHFPAPASMAPPLLDITGASVGYTPGEPVLRGIDLHLDTDERIALLGQNGNGKSTLAKLLSGRLKPETGEIKSHPKLKVGYFAQHQLDELNPKETPLEHLERAMPGVLPVKLRAKLGGFGFGIEKVDRAVETLSGGEKARLLLALMSREEPHVMILDEPTNHLDVDSREALIHALNEYEGALILITHDRHIIEACVDRLMLVADGTLKSFDGDLEDYKRYLLDQRRNGQSSPNSGLVKDNPRLKIAEAPPPPKLQKDKDTKRLEAEKRQRLAPLTKAVEKAERKAAQVSQDLANLELKLADPALYAPDTQDPRMVQTLQKEKGMLKAKLREAENAWLAAEDALEAAKSS